MGLSLHTGGRSEAKALIVLHRSGVRVRKDVTMRPPHFRRVVVPLLVLSVVTSAFAAEELLDRYPFDPACAWGRLSDGRGRVVRCLTQAEAKVLATASQPSAVPPVASQVPPTEPELPNLAFRATLVDVVADEGELPVAKKKLAVPLDRYADCVRVHGGLTAAEGEVRVRFLVRERGRAEGVSVESKKGLGDQAARCIADVVDRRPTGIPDAPLTGAVAIIRVTREK